MNQVQNAVEVFGFLPVLAMGLSLALMMAMAFSMSAIAQED